MSLSVTPFKMKSETTRNTVVYQFSDLPSGLKIHYASAGCSAAPYILLLHGYPSSANQYRKLIPILAENYHVVAPDLPGFGLTITPSGYQHTFANMASVICDFLSQQNITKSSTTGHRLLFESLLLGQISSLRSSLRTAMHLKKVLVPFGIL
jgi:alpha-beta hydrolase superfamily lysophospholipase